MLATKPAVVRKQWCIVLACDVNKRYLLPVLRRDCTPDDLKKYLELHDLAHKHHVTIEFATEGTWQTR
jgi:hypothetical protein